MATKRSESLFFEHIDVVNRVPGKDERTQIDVSGRGSSDTGREIGPERLSATSRVSDDDVPEGVGPCAIEQSLIVSSKSGAYHVGSCSTSEHGSRSY